MPGRLVALTLMMVCAGSDDPSTLTIRFASPSADAAGFSAAALIRRDDARRAGAGATARRANAARSALLLNAETPKPRELPRGIAARPERADGGHAGRRRRRRHAVTIDAKSLDWGLLARARERARTGMASARRVAMGRKVSGLLSLTRGFSKSLKKRARRLKG